MTDGAQHLEALAFDAYGTLYDVTSVITRCEDFFPGHGKALSDLWRVKQLEYTWLRTLMGKYQDFWGVTADALRFSCKALKLELPGDTERALMESYLHLSPFPEVPHALHELAGRLPLAILSNGSPEMLRKVTENNALGDYFRALLSVDELGLFKPRPEVYELAVERLQVPPQRIGFVSSNAWDVAGAKAYGLYVFWINRGGRPPEELGFLADHEIRTLDQIASLVHG